MDFKSDFKIVSAIKIYVDSKCQNIIKIILTAMYYIITVSEALSMPF